MNFLKKWQKIWQEDHLLQGVVRNTGYLFSSNTITMVLSMVQSILAARLLGVATLGVFWHDHRVCFHHQPPVLFPNGRSGGQVLAATWKKMTCCGPVR